MRVLLTIAYDGTNYFGWQRQANTMLTIQEAMEQALCAVYHRPVAVLGASRTDAGVHAKGQRAVFSLMPTDFNIPIKKLPYVINGLLPADIRITDAEEAAESFHPIRDAVKKTYAYHIWNAPVQDPLSRLYCEHVYLPLDFQRMRAAARDLIGTHDFKAFCASGGYAKTSTRTVYDIDLRQNGQWITMQITGNGFLYNMVRIIAGTLIDIGLGKIAAESIPAIIASRDRSQAGKTVSAKGLTLLNIYY